MAFTPLSFSLPFGRHRRFPDVKLSRKRAKQSSGLHLLSSLEWAMSHHPWECVKRVWSSMILHSSCWTLETKCSKVRDLPILQRTSGSLLKQKVQINLSEPLDFVQNCLAREALQCSNHAGTVESLRLQLQESTAIPGCSWAVLVQCWQRQELDWGGVAEVELSEGIWAQRCMRGEATLGSVILKFRTSAVTLYFASLLSNVGFPHAAILV